MRHVHCSERVGTHVSYKRTLCKQPTDVSNLQIQFTNSHVRAM